MMDRTQNDAVLPLEFMRGASISPGAKILFAELSAQAAPGLEVQWKANDFAAILSINQSTVYRQAIELYDHGYIDFVSRDFSESLMKKGLSGLGFGDKVCSWCGSRTTSLHHHHYPISKTAGGTETVDICPNCHQEWHDMRLWVRIIWPGT